MSAFLLIFLCLGGGVVLRRLGLLPPETPRVLNAVVFNLALPAVAITALSSIVFTRALWFPISMAWIVFGLGWLFVRALGRVMKWSGGTQAALILTAGLANTSFVGFPLIEAWLGKDALTFAVIVDQLGSFIVVSSLGLFVASSRRPFEARKTLMKLFSFPPFVALIGTLVFHLAGGELSPILRSALDRLGATLIPLALISVGFQLKWDLHSLRKFRGPLAWGLGFKLLLAPAAIFLIGWASGLFPSLPAQVTVLEASMGPMVTGAILALDYDREPELASLMIACGIPISLLTSAFWYWLVSRI